MKHFLLSIFKLPELARKKPQQERGKMLFALQQTDRMNEADSTTPWSKFGKLKHSILFHFPQETENGDLW